MRLNYAEAKEKMEELKKGIAQTYLLSELLTSESPRTQELLDRIKAYLEAMNTFIVTEGGEPVSPEVSNSS